MAQSRSAASPAPARAAAGESALPDDPPADERGQVAQAGTVVNGIIEYKPTPGLALPAAGVVAKENWSGRVGNRNVRVYRGAPAKDIPPDIIKAMAAYNCHVGTVTWQELGLRDPDPAQRTPVAPAPPQMPPSPTGTPFGAAPAAPPFQHPAGSPFAEPSPSRGGGF